MKNAAKIIPSVIQYKTGFPLFALFCVISFSCRTTSLYTRCSARLKERCVIPIRAPLPDPVYIEYRQMQDPGTGLLVRDWWRQFWASSVYLLFAIVKGQHLDNAGSFGSTSVVGAAK